MGQTIEAAMAVHVLVDKSGSMTEHRENVVKGLNALISQLHAANAPVLFTYSVFDYTMKVKLDTVPVYEMPTVTEQTYIPSGGTAMTSSIQAALSKLDKMNGKTKVLIIVTDGEADAGMSELKKDIAEREKRGQLVLWLGTGDTADHCASLLGFNGEKKMNFNEKNLLRVCAEAGLKALMFGSTGKVSA